jgi:hypothetical protein
MPLFRYFDFQTKERAMPTVVRKDEAYRLVDPLPDTATWNSLMHEICVREAIDRELADVRAGRTKNVAEIPAKYGLSE